MGTDYIKLELGAGNNPMQGGLLHNDIEEYPHIEIVGDCRSLPQIASGSVTFLRAMHLLEHFKGSETDAILQEWNRMLCPLGAIELATPDLRRLAFLYILKNISRAQFERDAFGFADIPDFPQADWDAAVFTVSKGYGDGSKWDAALHFLYDHIYTPGHNVHRWAFCPASIHAALKRNGFRQVHAVNDANSLYAWAIKEGAPR